MMFINYLCAVPDVPCASDSLPPPGLRLVEVFVSGDYEQRLLNVIDWQQFSGSHLPSSQKLLLLISLFYFSFIVLLFFEFSRKGKLETNSLLNAVKKMNE